MENDHWTPPIFFPGVDAQRLRWDRPSQRPLQPQPSRATTRKDGFAYVANFTSKSPS